LKQSGIRIDIQVASDGEQALAILKRSEENPEDSCPTLILLDWNLPKVSGAEVLAYVRQSARWQNIPVVVVTSSNSPADVEQLRRLGATVHFLKPTDLDAYLELRRIVRGLLPEAPCHHNKE
jgi:CheY-like chemotaxis protein